jgi:hypothetical protein
LQFWKKSQLVPAKGGAPVACSNAILVRLQLHKDKDPYKKGQWQIFWESLENAVVTVVAPEKGFLWTFRFDSAGVGYTIDFQDSGKPEQPGPEPVPPPPPAKPKKEKRAYVG